MHVLGFLKQKGGTGATTLVVHLAQAARDAGHRVAVVDLDPQQSATSWGRVRPDPLDPPVIPVAVEDLGRVLAAAAQDAYDLVLLDTPPHNSALTAAAARAASLAVLTARPSAFDLAAVRATCDIVRATTTPAVFVLTACPTRHDDSDQSDARASLRALLPRGIPVWDGWIGDRPDFRRAVAAGATVTEQRPKGWAAREIRELWDYLARTLVSPPASTHAY